MTLNEIADDFLRSKAETLVRQTIDGALYGPSQTDAELAYIERQLSASGLTCEKEKDAFRAFYVRWLEFLPAYLQENRAK